MIEQSKKLVAAMAAVSQYIISEQEALGPLPAEPEVARSETGGLTPVNVWGISGRQAQMQLRTLMQMRSIR